MRALYPGFLAILLILSPAMAQPAGEAQWRAWADGISAKSPFPMPSAAILADAPYADWKAVQDRQVIVEPIEYRSNGLKITGFIVRPATAVGKRAVLIWSRGGIGDVRQDEAQFVQMASWVRRGYIVIGSNYRGAAGSEGKDEFAGADVDDLVALLPLISRIPGADPSRLFGIGFSRGGTMILQAGAGRIPFKAVATAAAVTDLALAVQERPPLGKTFEGMMPDYAAEKANGFCRRSAICWPEKIAVPVLIAHGGGDRVVASEQAVKLARGLEKAGKPYRLLLLGGVDHPFPAARQTFFDQADAFFRAQ
jgi:dipeptidyl aminopeptidase/acylaminoacyl peptidase